MMARGPMILGDFHPQVSYQVVFGYLSFFPVSTASCVLIKSLLINAM